MEILLIDISLEVVHTNSNFGDGSIHSSLVKTIYIIDISRNEETSQTTADTVETTVAPDIPVVPDEKEEITFTSGLNIICVFCSYRLLSVHAL